MNVQPNPMQLRIDDVLARIGTCLTLNRPSLADMEKLHKEAEKLIPDAQEEVNRLWRISLDPSSNRAESDSAKQMAETAEIDLKRLQTSCSQLNDRMMAEFSAQERENRIIEYRRVRAERDDLVETIKTKWPDLREQIEELCRRICQSNLDIDKVNLALPEDGAPLDRAEGMARGFPDRNSYETAASFQAFRIVQILLPGTEPSEVAWPLDADYQMMIQNQRRVFPVQQVMHRYKQNNLKGGL